MHSNLNNNPIHHTRIGWRTVASCLLHNTHLHTSFHSIFHTCKYTRHTRHTTITKYIPIDTAHRFALLFCSLLLLSIALFASGSWPQIDILRKLQIEKQCRSIFSRFVDLPQKLQKRKSKEIENDVNTML